MDQIAIYLPNWLGDVVMSTPAIRALARQYPNAHLTIVGTPSACEMIKGLNQIHNIFVLPHRMGFQEMWHNAKQVREHAQDLFVVFPHSFRAALFAFLVRSRIRLGYARNGRRFLFTHPVKPHKVQGKIQPIYMVQEYLQLVQHLGCFDDGLGPQLTVTENDLKNIQKYIPPTNLLIGIAPGAAFGPSKRWPVERFAAVADRLYQDWNARCVLLTAPNEKELRETILKLCKFPLITCDENHPTVGKLKAAISLLDLLICNDSGPRHVAVAFGVPVVCLMGPTAPEYSEGPYEKGIRLRIPVECSPCQKPVCPIDHRCMTQITPEQVIHAVKNILEAYPPNPLRKKLLNYE